jgi:hypothetical protein
MKQIATCFWKEVHPELLTSIQGQTRRFIAFWVNPGRQPLDEFYVVPPLESFEVDDIVEYFREQLRLAQVEVSLIERLLGQLRRHGGRLPGTYQEMQRIIETLAGGSPYERLSKAQVYRHRRAQV